MPPITIVTNINNLDGHKVSVSAVDGKTLVFDTRSPERIAHEEKEFAILHPIAAERGKRMREESLLQEALNKQRRRR